MNIANRLFDKNQWKQKKNDLLVEKKKLKTKKTYGIKAVWILRAIYI